MSAITIDHVLAVLKPIWVQKTETASRVRQRLEAILSFAIATERRTAENAAQWQGRLEHVLPAPTKVTQVKHHAALDWREAPRLWPHINAASGQSARAVAFLYLTAARSSEVRFAQFSEFDLDESLWSLPGERMKNGKPHRVPLSEQAMQVIRQQAKTATNKWVFTNSKDQPLSDTALAKVLKSYPQKTTIHGLRSTFRDWAGEATSHPREIIEMALAHSTHSATEAAYARGDMLLKRRRLMEDWAQFLTVPEREIEDLIEIRADRKEWL